jgi:hypothetical protein
MKVVEEHVFCCLNSIDVLKVSNFTDLWHRLDGGIFKTNYF